MTRIRKLQDMTAEQLSALFISMDKDGEFVPMLMPPNLVKSRECADDVIRTQADWLCEEYYEGDFGVYTAKP